MTVATRPTPSPSVRDSQAVIELSASIFRRDVMAFYPQCRFEAETSDSLPGSFRSGTAFRLLDDACDRPETLRFDLFGVRHRLRPRLGLSFTAHDRKPRRVG